VNRDAGELDGLETIGPWTEVKHEIVQKYASAYSRLLTAQRRPTLYHVYVDAFAGAGRYISKQSGLLVPGTPEIALNLQPPFREYHLVDIDDLKVAKLEHLAEHRRDVTIHHGDCNALLVDRVLPRIKWSDFRRGLCILDPYGLHLHWSTVQAVAQARTTEIFLNFPVMDINRNALRRNPDDIEDEQARRMTLFWGDESWRSDFYRKSPQLDLFGTQHEGKAVTNAEVAEAYRRRLRSIAGFEFVPSPLPMRNATNAIVYYLFFASHKAVAGDIVEQIFAKYR
jgi:three-Cys-motif partner protein